MITVTIAVKDGTRTRGEILEFEDLGAPELAACDDLIHEMRDHLERLARVRAAKRKENEE